MVVFQRSARAESGRGWGKRRVGRKELGTVSNGVARAEERSCELKRRKKVSVSVGEDGHLEFGLQAGAGEKGRQR